MASELEREFPSYKVKDLGLAEEGKEAIALARREMPGLVELEKRYSGEKVLKGARISGSLHVTVQTAVMIEVLVALGAEVSWCSSNVLSTEDRAAAALASKGISIYAWKGESDEEYAWCMEAALHRFRAGPNLVIDDGGDMTHLLHEKYPSLLKQVRGIAEETTTGTLRARQMESRGSLRAPVMCINESVMKSKFDNIYGCRESLLDGIKRATDMMIAGKRAHICGYGDVGKGCAQSLSRMGAVVTVSEVDPICAMQASMEGYSVRRVEDVRDEVDIFVTATGNRDIIRGEDILRMKDYVVLCNIGHFNIEVDASWIYKNSLEVKRVGPGAERILLTNKKNVVLLAEGRLANLGCATGHPSFVMSTSFSCQVLALLKFWREEGYKENRVYVLDKKDDEEIARMHLEGVGGRLTVLTDRQAEYMGVPVEGPYKNSLYRY
jgi:adenosylhomocysteinase